MNVVLFLGAGFSRAFGLPVMKEFYDHVIQADYLTNGDKNFVRQLREKTRYYSSMIPGAEDDLEHLLSVSLMASLGSDEDFHDQLCRVLQKVYGHISHKSPRDIFRNAFNILLGHNRPYQTLTAITTNYDLIVEQALVMYAPATIPGEWKSEIDPSGSGSLYRKGESRDCVICKLHGSLNWSAPEGSEEKIIICDDFINREFTINGRSEIRSVPRACTSTYNPARTPFITPPTLYKGNLPNCLKATWAYAKNSIETATHLIFIGYSFPESDIHMRYFLGTALSANLDLRRIDILDPSATSIKSRLQERKEYGESFINRLNPIESKWEESNYSIE